MKRKNKLFKLFFLGGKYWHHFIKLLIPFYPSSILFLSFFLSFFGLTLLSKIEQLKNFWILLNQPLSNQLWSFFSSFFLSLLFLSFKYLKQPTNPKHIFFSLFFLCLRSFLGLFEFSFWRFFNFLLKKIELERENEFEFLWNESSCCTNVNFHDVPTIQRFKISWILWWFLAGFFPFFFYDVLLSLTLLNELFWQIERREIYSISKYYGNERNIQSNFINGCWINSILWVWKSFSEFNAYDQTCNSIIQGFLLFFFFFSFSLFLFRFSLSLFFLFFQLTLFFTSFEILRDGVL